MKEKKYFNGHTKMAVTLIQITVISPILVGVFMLIFGENEFAVAKSFIWITMGATMLLCMILIRAAIKTDEKQS